MYEKKNSKPSRSLPNLFVFGSVFNPLFWSFYTYYTYFDFCHYLFPAGLKKQLTVVVTEAAAV